MASENAQPLGLNGLCNEILIKIILCLPVEHLCILIEVSKRFRYLAYFVFNEYYAKHMVFTNPIDRMPATTNIIKCFGSLIHGATIEGGIVWNLNELTLKLIEKNCLSLKKLRLVCFHFNKETVPIVKMLSPRLNTIELLYCTIESNQFHVTYNIALKEVENLKELVIIGGDTEIDLKFLNKKWPEIEKLEIIGPHLANEHILSLFLRKNREIKYFSYLPDKPTQPAQSWMKSVEYSLPNTLELSIKLTQGIVYSTLLGGLRNLQRIVIDCNGHDDPIHKYIDILSKIDSIEALSLWHVKYDEIMTIPAIDKVKTLELREVESVLDRNILAQLIAERWNNVKNLYLDHSTVSSADNMGLFVENMVQLKNLYLCDMKSFCLLPRWGVYNAWCSKRRRPLQIFVDSRFLPPCQTNVPNKPIIFRAFKDRMTQMMNVICSNSLKSF